MLVVHVAPGAPVPPATHSLRGAALLGGVQSTWQVCVLVQLSTPLSAPPSAPACCGFTGSHPGSVLPGGTSGAPPSVFMQPGCGVSGVSDTLASTQLPFLMSCVTMPVPIAQPTLLRRSTVK